MLKLTTQLEKIFPSVKNGLIPALFFGYAVISFYLKAPFNPSTNILLHHLFYTAILGTFLVLFYFNQGKPLFFIICASLTYIIVNNIKNNNTDYLLLPQYQNLCLFLPLNLLFFYFLPNKHLLAKRNIYLLLGLFLEYTVIEHLPDLNLNLFSNQTYGLSGVALILFILGFIILFVHVTLSGKFIDYGLFFAFLNIGMGLFYSPTASGLTSFFTSGMFILTITSCIEIYIKTYKDTLTGFESRNAYVAHTKKLPLKYSIGLLCIDDYDKLNSLGKRNKNLITEMIADRIAELEKNIHIYRYDNDKFILIFNNLDKKESFARIEEVRRGIAAALFQYHPRRKALKLTISAAVSEKKRSDANSYEVLSRAEKALQKTRAFSNNVTSQA